MKIAGFEHQTFTDYPGKIASIVFTVGCNMNCPWCHNRILVENKSKILYTESMILEHLEKRKNLIDGLVITGGEPTLQKDLEGFIRNVKAIGTLVKLDTNGLHPEVVKRLLDEKLIDYIAMDIKAPFDKYSEICGVKVDIEKIKDSITLIKNSEIDYEFRTTFVPMLTKEDVISLSEEIKGAKAFYIQQYRITDDFSTKPHPVSDLEELKSVLKDKFETFKVRGI